MEFDRLREHPEGFRLRVAEGGDTGYDCPAGFGTSKVSSRALSYANKVDRLDEFAERSGDVVAENLDWADVFAKYDGEDTVFYCDRPTSATRTTTS
ncbi:hypothetical protein ABNG02_09635 [Halorubrum ejinorense]|uniref:Uncharacterized protein n=1 Tax=Halorubrum ejinorense TaxID=425309 RepID=A0AAV3SMS0_9EURY